MKGQKLAATAMAAFLLAAPAIGFKSMVPLADAAQAIPFKAEMKDGKAKVSSGLDKPMEVVDGNTTISITPRAFGNRPEGRTVNFEIGITMGDRGLKGANPAFFGEGWSMDIAGEGGAVYGIKINKITADGKAGFEVVKKAEASAPKRMAAVSSTATTTTVSLTVRPGEYVTSPDGNFIVNFPSDILVQNTGIRAYVLFELSKKACPNGNTVFVVADPLVLGGKSGMNTDYAVAQTLEIGRTPAMWASMGMEISVGNEFSLATDTASYKAKFTNINANGATVEIAQTK